MLYSKRITASLLALGAVMAVSTAAPSPQKAIEASLRRLSGELRDLDATANLTITPPGGSGDAREARQFTMLSHLQLKMPDRVRFQVLNSSIPLFNRWVLLQKGNVFVAYDPVGDRQVTTDFKRLTGREPIRLDTSFAMIGLMFDPRRYHVTYQGKATLGGKPVYTLRLTLPSPRRINPYTLVARSHLYVEAARLIPLRADTFTPNGELATSTEFTDFQPSPIGLAPMRIRVSDIRGERIFKKMQAKRSKRIKEDTSIRETEASPKMLPVVRPEIVLYLKYGSGLLYPWKVTGRGGDGGASEWLFSNVRVNTGLTDATFRM